MEFSKINFKTFTVTVAAPALFTSASHELYAGDTILFETTGALPTGLLVDTEYFVVYNGIGANVFEVSTAKGGTPITTTGTQSGTHSFLKTNRARLVPVVENNE